MYTGVSSMETETEADSSDMIECPRDHKPTTGMIIFDVLQQSFCISGVDVQGAYKTPCEENT